MAAGYQYELAQFVHTIRVDIARRVFDMVPEPGRQLGMWNAMICGYAHAGMDEEALELFARMEAEAGCVPSETTMVSVLPACARSEAFAGKEVTFIAVLAACSHSGLVDRGLELFHGMKRDHGVEPTPDLHACVVDVLGRAGRLGEAYDIINSMMPGQHQVSAWSSLLGA